MKYYFSLLVFLIGFIAIAQNDKLFEEGNTFYNNGENSGNYSLRLPYRITSDLTVKNNIFYNFYLFQPFLFN